ncbi:MAG TPA: DegT/DnrJ/EryC1/StrS aminotransferase family protein [Ignavibacteria bacterium]|nr:DegT/DnrJ/EryC1/StrS aminotransferase family protein [Ignavibacteria bacterium]
MIPISKPSFDSKDLEIIQNPLKSGWVVQGEYVKKFEKMFCEWTGAKNAIAVTSCTTALHLALSALGIKDGDEVIVPSFTWISTANSIEFTGAKPIFTDIELDTFNIDIRRIKEKITNRTKAIIPVHLFGLCVNMEEILKIAKEYKLKVVEDAACGFDSYFKGTHSGRFGDFGCFSFHPRKSITTGEGGMIITDNDEMAKLCRSLRDHGAIKSDFQRHNEEYSFLLSEYPYLGYNYRMTDIQGALGTTQMEKAEKIMKDKRTIAKKYDEELKDLNGINLPYKHKDFVHGYQSYVLLFKYDETKYESIEKQSDIRNKILSEMEKKGVITRQGTHCAALQKYYSEKYKYTSKDFPNGYMAEKLSIALPLYSGMNEEEVKKVINTFRETYNKYQS